MMKSISPLTHGQSRFDFGAWAVFCLAVVLILLSAGLLIYRFTLPTDGWAVTYEGVDNPSWVYWRNLAGASSPLQTNDLLMAVEGQSLSGTAINGTTTATPIPTPTNWVVGRNISVTVLRSGQLVSFDIPVVRWTPAVWLRFNALDFAQLTRWLEGLLLTVIGFFAFLRRPELPSVRALLLFITATSANIISLSLPDGLSVQFNQPALLLTSFFSINIYFVLIGPALFVFTLYFPRPKQFLQRHSWLGLIPFALGLLVLALALFLKSAIPGWIYAITMLGASVVSLVQARLTQRDSVSRAQLRWALGGLVAGLGVALLMLVVQALVSAFPIQFSSGSEWVRDLLLVLPTAGANIGFTIVGITLAIAVLRYRLFDIEVIIRKTLVYTVLTGLLALVYFGSVILLQWLSTTLTSQQLQQSQIGIVASTLLIAALFTPLRRRVQSLIDKRFFRRKYDAQQVLAGFAATARNEVELEQLTAQLLHVINETVQPASVGLWLRQDRAQPKR